MERLLATTGIGGEEGERGARGRRSMVNGSLLSSWQRRDSGKVWETNCIESFDTWSETVDAVVVE